MRSEDERLSQVNEGKVVVDVCTVEEGMDGHMLDGSVLVFVRFDRLLGVPFAPSHPQSIHWEIAV